MIYHSVLASLIADEILASPLCYDWRIHFDLPFVIDSNLLTFTIVS